MKSRLIPIVCISLLSACAGNAVKDSDSIQQSAMQQAKAIEQTPETVIAEGQTLQLEAQKEDLYFYSPSYMEQAEDALEDAEDAIKSKKLPHEIITHALAAQKLFKRGLENKTTVLTQLSASFDGLAMLKAIETDTVLASDYQDLRDDTKDLIILIEQGKTTEAINEQKELLMEISDVEIKTLKKNYLTVAENALEKAEDADADDYAAKSFSDAQKNLETFEKFIETSAKQRELIKEKSLSAIRLAQHAEHVSKAAAPLLKLNPETAEEHILFIEQLMNRIAVALQQDDISHLNLNGQSMAIAQTAESVNKLASLQTQPANQIQNLESEQTLASEQVVVKTIVEETLKEVNTPDSVDVAAEVESADTNDTNNVALKPEAKDVTPSPEANNTASTEALKSDLESTQLNTEEVATTETAPVVEATQEQGKETEVSNAPINVQTTDNAEIVEAAPDSVVTTDSEVTTEVVETAEVAEKAEAALATKTVETAAVEEAPKDEPTDSNPETPTLNNAVAAEQAP